MVQEDAKGGVEYRQGIGWGAIGEFTPTFTGPSSQFAGQATATGYVEPNFSMPVDGLAGPFVALKGYLQGDSWAATGRSDAVGWELYGGAAGYAGMAAEPLGWNLGEVQLQLFDDRTLLASSVGTVADTAPPSVPENVVATAASPSEIDLSWGAATDDTAVKNYKVYVGANLWKTISGTYAADKGIPPGTEVCYSVEAVDEGGNVSAPSKTVCATTPLANDSTPPTATTAPNITAVTSNSVTLSWKAATDNVGVAGYTVDRNGSPIATVSTTGYTDSSLTKGAKYCYTVQAFDAAGNVSAASGQACATTASGGVRTVDLYVVNGAPVGITGSVSVIDPAIGKIVGSIPVGTGSGDIAVSSDGSRAYVTNSVDNTVSVIDTATDHVVAVVPVGNNPSGVAVSPDGGQVYVINTLLYPSVSVISAASDKVVATWPMSVPAAGIAVSPDGSHVYITAFASPATMYVVNAANGQVVAGVDLSAGAGPVTVSPDGSKVYIPNDSVLYGALSVIDAATDKVVGTVPVGAGPNAVAVSPDGSRAYVVNGVSGTVSVIDTATDKVVGTVPVGAGPNAVAVSPDGSQAYVANSLEGTVSVIDTASDEVVVTLSGLYNPSGIAVGP